MRRHKLLLGRERGSDRKPEHLKYPPENLEFLFGVRRAKDIRTHGGIYADESPGTFGVLTTEEQVVRGRATEATKKRLERYCRQDVKSMFKIARHC